MVPRMPDPTSDAQGADAALLRDALGRGWYHTIDLPGGGATPGAVDQRALARTLVPPRLDGLRCLDVGTYDGFWAFTMEERGAADVAALDVPEYADADWPPRNRRMLTDRAGDERPGERFALAHRLRGSRVRRVEGRLQALERADVGGAVDYAVLSDLLLHLRDPVGGLEAVRRTLAPGARLLVAEEVNVATTLLFPRRPFAALKTGRTDYDWWQLNLAALREVLRQAGFRVRRRHLHRLDAVATMRVAHAAFEVEVDPGA